MTSDSIGLVLQQGSFAALTLAAGMNIVEEKCTYGDIETQCQTYKQFFSPPRHTSGLKNVEAYLL